MTNTRKWLNVELSQADANELKDFLNDNDIEFESSECYDEIHFEVLVDEYEKKAVNDFLNELE